jgi:putative lipoprotein
VSRFHRAAVLSLLLATVLLFLSACAASPKAADDSKLLEAHQWKVATLAQAAVNSAPPLTAQFAAGQLTGSTGINRYQAAYVTQPGNLISIKVGPMTLAAGTPQAMALETAYLKALSEAKSYTVDATKLTLADSAGKALVTYEVFTPTSLTGTEWDLVMYNNGRQGFQGVLATVTTTAIFGEDGTLSGNGGVNQYHTTYKTSGSTITIAGPIAATMMAGDPAAMEQEAAYLKMLPEATTFKIEGDELMLRRSSDDAAIAQYRAKK